MGVLRMTDPPTPIRVQDSGIITYDDYILDDDVLSIDSVTDSDADERQPVVQSAPTTPRRRRQREGRAERKIQRFLEIDRLNGGMKVKRRMGARKMRRLENAKLMYALADPDDICEDYSDILQSTVSAFAQLFIEQENMRAWNEFIEKDEEEQRSFLEESRKGGHEKETGSGNRVGGRNERPTIEGVRDAQKDGETRQHHPAYSAAACFSRMDQRFKSLFVQKRLPWSFISDQEQELRGHFLSTASQHSEWRSSPMASAWHRLLLHGISQYLSLHSTSVESEGDGKTVQVRNERAYFIPPHSELVAFIAHLHKNERRKWSTGL